MRGPSYSAEEMNLMQKLANTSSPHKDKVAGFFKAMPDSDRTEDAISQKIRKLTPAAPRPLDAPRRGRPPKSLTANVAPVSDAKPVVKAAPAKAKLAPVAPVATNGNGNGHGHVKPEEVTMSFRGVLIQGNPRAVGALLTQLSA